MNAIASIPLSNAEAELSLIGTFLMYPACFSPVADDIKEEWLTDPLAAHLFVAMREVQGDGGTFAPVAVMNSLPAEVSGVARKDIIVRVTSSAVAPEMVPSLIKTIKELWARRELVSISEIVVQSAAEISANPFDIAKDMVADLDTISATKSRRGGSMVEASVSRLMETIHNGVAKGPTTGLRCMDESLNGWPPGHYVVLAGRPGMGKSALVCTSLRRTAQSGAGVALFSLEMGGEEVAARCISDAMDDYLAPTYSELLKGRVSNAQLEDLKVCQDSFAELPLYVDDQAGLTVSEIAARAKKAKLGFEASGRTLNVVCVDHIGKIRPSGRYKGNMVAETAEVSEALRALAKELDVCVIAVSQLSRQVESRDDKRPTLSDLRWSGEIEQDAHAVILMYREAYYLANDQNADPNDLMAVQNKLELLIRKNRNGATGDRTVWCDIAHSRIRDEAPI